MNALVVKSL